MQTLLLLFLTRPPNEATHDPDMPLSDTCISAHLVANGE